MTDSKPRDQLGFRALVFGLCTVDCGCSAGGERDGGPRMHCVVLAHLLVGSGLGLGQFELCVTHCTSLVCHSLFLCVRFSIYVPLSASLSRARARSLLPNLPLSRAHALSHCMSVSVWVADSRSRDTTPCVKSLRSSYTGPSARLAPCWRATRPQE